MAAFLDICRFLPTAGGTTDWTYAAIVQGHQSPAAAGASNGVLYKYRAESSDLTQWEVGEGAYNASTGTLARSTVLFNSVGNTAKVNFSALPQVAIVALKEDLVSIEETNAFSVAQQAQARSNIAASGSLRTRRVFTSGSGTYSLPAGCKTILVRMVGGGGGGGGGVSGSTSGNSGGATTFGSSLLVAAGGGGAGGPGAGYAGGGGASGGDININGGWGWPSYFAGGSSSVFQGTAGGNSAFGGAGTGGWPGASGSNGSAGGGGGGGAGPSQPTAGSAAAGGGAGAYCEKLIVSLAASYPFVVGAGGSGGLPGSGGTAGGSGGSGFIIIDEYY